MNAVKASVLDGSTTAEAPRRKGGLKIKKVSLNAHKRRHKSAITRKSKTFNF